RSQVPNLVCVRLSFVPIPEGLPLTIRWLSARQPIPPAYHWCFSPGKGPSPNRGGEHSKTQKIFFVVSYIPRCIAISVGFSTHTSVLGQLGFQFRSSWLSRAIKLGMRGCSSSRIFIERNISSGASLSHRHK